MHRLPSPARNSIDGRYPFVVSKGQVSGLSFEELAFAVDPDAKPGELPNSHSGARGLDVVQLTFRNAGDSPAQQWSS